MHVHEQFPAGTEFVSAARRWICAAVVGTRYEPLGDNIALCVSELFTNVILHTTADDIRVDLYDTGNTLEIRVCGNGRSHSEPRIVEHAAIGGLGLHIVDQISTRWGVDYDHGNNTVWIQFLAEELDHDTSRVGQRTHRSAGV